MLICIGDGIRDSLIKDKSCISVVNYLGKETIIVLRKWHVCAS